MAKNDTLEDQQYKLLFAVRRSIRYHDRRRAFFELMHRISSVFMVLLASSIFLDLLGNAVRRPAWLTTIALIAAMLGALDIIVGFARSATLHHDFKRRFIQLEIAISKSETEQALRDIEIERLRIEQDEPPVYRALDLLCHNEVAHADGVRNPDDFAAVKWYQSLTRHIWHWANIVSTTERG
ncbi:MAG: hypothetical protein ABIN99_12860 [Nitrosospira sp.]